jgi:hypothetical protein
MQKDGNKSFFVTKLFKASKCNFMIANIYKLVTSVIGSDSFVVAHLERIQKRRNVDIAKVVPEIEPKNISN